MTYPSSIIKHSQGFSHCISKHLLARKMPLVIEGTLHHLHANLPTFQEKKLSYFMLGKACSHGLLFFGPTPHATALKATILKLREALGTGLSI
jgi:hypothetical protein